MFHVNNTEKLVALLKLNRWLSAKCVSIFMPILFAPRPLSLDDIKQRVSLASESSIRDALIYYLLRYELVVSNCARDEKDRYVFAADSLFWANPDQARWNLTGLKKDITEARAKQKAQEQTASEKRHSKN